jgi:large subunit ribosomal protein L10
MMMRVVICLTCCWLYNTVVNGFVLNPSSSSQQRVDVDDSSTTRLYGGGSGYATSLAGKKETVEQVKGLLEKTELLFSVPASSITVSQVQNLRRNLPDGTSCQVIKNKLMARAIVGTDYEPIGTTLLTGSNMWFFIEDDISGSIKAYNDFVKETNKRETHEIIGGCMEQVIYQTEGVQAIGKLPSKLELYTMIARSINAVPTKLARVVKEPGNKLARAIKLATDPEKENKE